MLACAFGDCSGVFDLVQTDAIALVYLPQKNADLCSQQKSSGYPKHLPGGKILWLIRGFP